ncbi:hypothetical protein [Pseudomonas cichorii]|uniref:hypothetical protein n=1 Tax=Pseudomonas cichorii TaxID=36746 RepID=UPI001604CB32|nr:hypothetical protein [Pseudomonas cichorii]
MSHSAQIIDFSLFRKRRQAQQLGRLMWAMYAQQAGIALQPGNEGLASSKPPRQA